MLVIILSTDYVICNKLSPHVAVNFVGQSIRDESCVSSFIKHTTNEESSCIFKDESHRSTVFCTLFSNYPFHIQTLIFSVQLGKKKVSHIRTNYQTWYNKYLILVENRL